MIAFLLVYFLLFRTGFSGAVVQKKVLESFTAGQTVTLECLISVNLENYFSWFKQTLGEAPTCIVSLYAESSTPVFYGEFKNNHRMSVQKEKNTFVLNIKEAKPSDAGIYYCGARDYDLITFSNGLFLNYKDASTKQHHIKQFLSGPNLGTEHEPEFNPGDSVNLHCSVLTERCEENHTIYWFRHEFGDAHPGLIYKDGNTTDQCEKRSEKDVQSCIYNLPKKNLNLTDAGVYYCAVATCGEILFGNGSRINIRASSKFSWTDVKVPVLASTNILCLVIIVILLCKRAQKQQQKFSGPQSETRRNVKCKVKTASQLTVD
ncbi:novel immune-type receptor 12 precursor [Danio rerio]|uniref:Novel immune-type receptor 12 precursor n=1 Tax=Danio rerio TaxID=7955 RepID=Q5SNP8_DANRE|nr:novel immune-type receptor 12 precursor [Danio rerio]CAI21231.1 novel immune-type receptor 12.1 [Danio rerio]|eukprot:NP_001020667.1 novel immune-type receptor 12 precursor [Danio rerio]